MKENGIGASNLAVESSTSLPPYASGLFSPACEKTFRLTEKRIYKRLIFRSVMNALELGQEVLLFTGKVCGNLYKYLNMLVPTLSTSQGRHSFAFQAENGTVLSAFRYLEFCLAGNRRHFDNPPQGGRHKINRQLAYYVKSVPLENLMLFHMYHHIKIP